MGSAYSFDSSTDSSHPPSSITGTQYVTSRRFSHALRHNSTVHNRLFDATASHVLDFLMSEDDQLARFASTYVKFTHTTVVVSNVSIPSFNESGIVIKTRENSDVVLRIVLKSGFKHSDGKILIGKDLVNEMRRRISATITASFAIYPNMTTLTVAIGVTRGYYESIAREMNADDARFSFGWIAWDMRNVIVPEKVKRIVIAIKSPQFENMSVMKIWSLDRIFSYPSRTNKMGIGPNHSNDDEWKKYIEPIYEKFRDDTNEFFERFRNEDGTTDSYVAGVISVPNLYYSFPGTVCVVPESRQKWITTSVSPKKQLNDSFALRLVGKREKRFEEFLTRGKKRRILATREFFVAKYMHSELSRDSNFQNIVNDDSNDDYNIGFELEKWVRDPLLVIYIVASHNLNFDALASSIRAAINRIKPVVDPIEERSRRTYEKLKSCEAIIEADIVRFSRGFDVEYISYSSVVSTVAGRYFADSIETTFITAITEAFGENVPIIDQRWIDYLRSKFTLGAIEKMVRKHRTADNLRVY